MLSHHSVALPPQMTPQGMDADILSAVALKICTASFMTSEHNPGHMGGALHDAAIGS